MVATVEALTGVAPRAWFGDSADPSRPQVRSLAEEAARVVRTRVLNPKWLAAMREHGYKGAFEVAATVDYLFGYDATAGVVEDWMYERVTQAYVADPEMRDFFERVEPVGAAQRVRAPARGRRARPVGCQRRRPRRAARRPARGRGHGGAAHVTHRRVPLQRGRRAATRPSSRCSSPRSTPPSAACCSAATRARPRPPWPAGSPRCARTRRSSTCPSAPPRSGSSARSTSPPRSPAARCGCSPGCSPRRTAACSTSTRSTCSPTTSSTCCSTSPPPGSTGSSATRSPTSTRPASCSSASMNPEEGDLRPQLLDRFGLAVDVADDVRPGRSGPRPCAAAWPSTPTPTASRPRGPTEEAELADRLRAGPAGAGRRRRCSGRRRGRRRRRGRGPAGRPRARPGRGRARRLGGPNRSSAEDLRAVAPLVLAHRARRHPLDPPGARRPASTTPSTGPSARPTSPSGPATRTGRSTEREPITAAPTTTAMPAMSARTTTRAVASRRRARRRAS